MKFNNENAKEPMVYVAPKSKVFSIAPKAIICLSVEQGSVQGLNWDDEDNQ